MKKYLHHIGDALRRGRHFMAHDIWHIEQFGEEVSYGYIIKHIRVAILLVKGLVRDDLLLRASALTFATMLAVVPFFAIMLFLIQTFNVGDALGDLFAPSSGAVSSITEPAAPVSPIMTWKTAATVEERNRKLWENIITLIFAGFDKETPNISGQDMTNPVKLIMTYAERGSNPHTLTLAGLVFVLTTIFGLMMNIEGCFNTIWGVRRSRSWYRMFSDYMMILLFLPFLVAGVLSVTAILESSALSGRLGGFAFGLRSIQYVVSWLMFTALYFVVPNTRVKLRYALLAGIVAGTAWCLLSLAYVKFQFGLPRYNIVYSTFAQIPVVLMWVYSSWLVLLIGAEITFAYQNEKTFAMERLAQGASFAYCEAVGLWAMAEMCRRFDAGLPGVSVETSAKAWHVPTRLLNETLSQLEEARLVVQSASNPPTYQPARSIDKIRVEEVISCLRESGQDPSSLRKDHRFQQLVASMVTAANQGVSCTMGDLIRSTEASEQHPANTGAPAEE